MITEKQEILNIINDLPDDTTLYDAIYTLYFHYKLQRSEDDFKNGRVMSIEELRKYIDRLEEKKN